MLTHDLPNVGNVYEVEVRTEIDGRKQATHLIVIGKNHEQVREKTGKYVQEESPNSKILGTAIAPSFVVY